MYYSFMCSYIGFEMKQYPVYSTKDAQFILSC